MTVQPDGQQPIDKDDNRTVGRADTTLKFDRPSDQSAASDAETADETRVQSQHEEFLDNDSLALDRTANHETGKQQDSATAGGELGQAPEPAIPILKTQRTTARQVATTPGAKDVTGTSHQLNPVPDDSFVPSTIDRYQVRRELGQGAFGRVYEAHDPQLDRLVAIKVSKELKGRDAVDRFLREARSAAHLRHPNIIPVFEYGQIDDLSMIVYELVDGQTLRSYIKQNEPLPLSETITIIRKIANGLDYAHNEGIIHRDMKPDNVLIDKKGEPHIADFGCARRFDDQDMHQTVEGSILGTPMYMSPEQASGRAHRADGRTDVWSLGVMLYEMVSGEKPFQGKLSDLLHLIRHRDPKPLRRINPSIPRDIETICSRCLRRELDQRFATAGELAAELERFQRGEPILSRRISLISRTWLWAKRNRAVASLLTAVAVTLLLGTAVSTALLFKALDEQKKRVSVSLGQLTTAESNSLENILTVMNESKNSMLKRIRERLTETDLGEYQRRRLLLGKLHLEKGDRQDEIEFVDDGTIKYLLSADGYELVSFCKAFSDIEKTELKKELWRILEDDPNQTDESRLRAACGLAQIDPESNNWDQIQDDVAGYLTAMNLEQVQQWLPTVTPIRDRIKPELEVIFHKPRTIDDASPETAAAILSSLFDPSTAVDSGEPEIEKQLQFLVDLVCHADPRQLAQLMNTLDASANRAKSRRMLIERLQNLSRSDETTQEVDYQQANLILALVQLDHPVAWLKLTRKDNNTAATEVIERLGAASTRVDLLIKKIDEFNLTHSNPDALAVILLALGQFTDGQIPKTKRSDFLPVLKEIFQNHGDARVHSAARWLLAQWQFEQVVLDFETNPNFQRDEPDDGKNWHVDSSGNTFVVFQPDHCPRRFGICIHEVTLGQFEPFVEYLLDSGNTIFNSLADSDRVKIKAWPEKVKTLDKNLPMPEGDELTFFTALSFCRWLSDNQNLEPAVPAINKLKDREYGMSYKSFDLNNNGYRLPTAREWQFACCASSNTVRPFGISEQRIEDYAWYVANSRERKHPVAALKPNESGLFDMLGNSSEWCLDWSLQKRSSPEWQPGENQEWIDFTQVLGGSSTDRECRGGSYLDQPTNVRTAKRSGADARNGHDYLGFRLARSYPPAGNLPSERSNEKGK